MSPVRQLVQNIKFMCFADRKCQTFTVPSTIVILINNNINAALILKLSVAAKLEHLLQTAFKEKNTTSKCL